MSGNGFRPALLELADDHLILGHRLSELCGHAPMLEEDLAIPNLALDLIGAARGLYQRICDLEGGNRSEDDLAYLRSEREFRNCLLVERPNGDFANLVLRQFWFSSFMVEYWQRATDCPDPEVRGIALKSLNESRYHVRHSGEWVIRLGDGTGESARRMSAAVDNLCVYTEELFMASDAAATAAGCGLLPDRPSIRPEWLKGVARVHAEAGLQVPSDPLALVGGREGRHDECLGHLLAEMQSLHRAHPGATW